MTKYQLMDALFNHTSTPNKIRTHDGGLVLGWVQSVQREDGSGGCFNVVVRIAEENDCRTVFVRTID